MNCVLLVLVAALAADPEATVHFEAPKFGVTTELPKQWPIAAREDEDRVFVALVPQADPDRPGVAACELGLAPENLDSYRTRIDANARRGRRPGKLVRNEIVKTERGEQLETVWEFHPREGGVWRELSVRLVAFRQMYTFTLNVDEATFPAAKTAFDAIIGATKFQAPNTGADLVDRAANRWVQREFKFSLDLPEGWSPVLAPSEVALFFANGPAHEIWSDNVLVIARPHRNVDLGALAVTRPDQLRKEEPNCQVVTCRVVKQNGVDALETVVRTQRGPFSMTVIERLFKGDRFDYEVKYTLETKRFDELAPNLRRSLDSFREVPGQVTAVRRSPSHEAI
jgi:hypothetical protein